MKISILNYDACNLASVYNSFYRLGIDINIIEKADEIKNSDKIIIPGVGSARHAINYLTKKELIEPLKNFISSGKPILGICLGLQLFANRLFENGESNGLGLIQGEVISFPKNKKFHIGWNKVKFDHNEFKIFQLKNESYFYFCHSYYVKLKSNDELSIGTTNFTNEFPSIIIKDNFIGTQFHPEKSQLNGQKFIESFIEWKI
ncbi:imidazole glycerol phosphate synthase subunit HisH [Candidatus Pelagibacter ubique]|nr:imidazole glycerol phosphate synthase subunit HisH [Candidatus Pelagibacter ubique]